MDNPTLEHYLAHYCAATLLGEKSASLVSLPREECARIGLQAVQLGPQVFAHGVPARGCACLCGHRRGGLQAVRLLEGLPQCGGCPGVLRPV